MTDDTDSGWLTYRLDEIIDFNPKETLSKGADAPYVEMAALPQSGRWHHAPVLRAVNSGSRFRDDDTLLARITPCLENGKTAQVRGLGPGVIGWGSTEFIVMRAKREVVDADFVYLLARDPGFREYAIQQMTGTSGRQRVPTESIASFEVSLPSLGEQRRIAEVLGALDDRVEAAARLTELLLNEAHAIYELRAMGESAQVVRVGDIVSALDKGVSYKGAGLAEQGPWLVNLANFSAAGRFKREGTKHYTLPVRPQHRVSPGDLVIANTDLTQDRVILGQPALIPPGAHDASVTHHVYAVRFVPERVNYRLPLYFALRSQDFQDRAYLFGSGTTVAGLSRDAILDYTCAMPDEGELPALSAELATRLEAAWQLETEIDELGAARDFLLPRLVSGELRIAAAEELVEAAT